MCAIGKIAQRYQKHHPDSVLPTVAQLTTHTVMLSAASAPSSEPTTARLSAQEKQQ